MPGSASSARISRYSSRNARGGLFFASLLLGALVGAINGFFIAYEGIPAFIVTLATLAVVRGVALLITQGYSIPIPADSLFAFMGRAWVLGIPHGFAVMHGKTRRGALVFDIADIVKDAIILPLAFICASENTSEQEFRQECLNYFTTYKALDTMFDVVKEMATFSDWD